MLPLFVIQQGTAVSTDEPTHVIHCARISVANWTPCPVAG